MKKLLLILLAMLMLLSFAACGVEAPPDNSPESEIPDTGDEGVDDGNESEEEEAQKINVRIDYSMYGDDDELIVEFVETEIGSLLTEPEEPSNPHYTFGGWYNSEDETPWLFDTHTVTADTSIYAVWIPIDYTATFVGPFDIEPIVYNIYNSYISLPDDDYERWDIEGFYADSECTEKLTKLPEPEEVFGDYTVYFKASYIPFEYRVNKRNDGIEGNEEVEIIGLYDASYTEITIPATIKGLPVVKFSFAECENRRAIKKVTVSGELRTVNEYAFKGLDICEAIIEEGVSVIANSAFSGCSALTKLVIPESVTEIGANAFAYCTSLSELIIPGRITSIASGAFSNCDSIVSAVFENAEVIGGFEYCDGLETVEVGAALHTVNSGAFFGCSSLKEIKLTADAPAKNVFLKNIKSNAFGGCSALESVGSLEKLELLEQGAFNNCTSFMSGKVLDISSLERIGERAFYGCPIKNIVFSDALVSIAEKAFYNCTSLEGIIYLPPSILEVGDDVFNANDNIKVLIESSSDITINNSWWYQNVEGGNWHTGIKRIYIGAYFKTIENDDGKYIYTSDVLNLAYISIVDFEPRESEEPIVLTVPEKIGGKDVTRIDNYAFEGCDNIARIILPDTVYNIGDYAFYDCDELVRGHIDRIVQRIGDYAFAECEKLEFAYIGVAELGTRIFKNTAVRTVYFYGREDNADNWDEVWFGGSSITETVYNVYLTDSGLLWKKDENPATSMQGAVIVGQTYNSEHKLLPLADIPSKLKPFNENTEYTVFKIDYGAFTDNSFVDYISIPDTVKIIGSNAFYNCALLQYNEYNGALYIGNESNPYLFCVKAKSLDIETLELHPDVRFIGAYAFADCSALGEVSFPEGLVCIGDSAFKNCGSIAELTIPDSVESIESRAFYQCYGIRELNIGAVEEIGSQAFYQCGTMELTLGEGIINISERAFYDCYPYKIVIPNTVKRIGQYAFFRTGHIGGQGLTHDITVGNGIEYLGKYALCTNGSGYLTGGYEDDYAYYLGNAKNNFLVLVAVKDKSITSFNFRSDTKIIYSDAFSGCTELESINIPYNILSIGSMAFSNCSSLVSVTFSSGLTHIGEEAFYECSSLTELCIPETVKEIGDNAFANCPSLESLYLRGTVKEIGYDICIGCDNVTIYCTAKEKPSYWRYDWNTHGCEVVWNYGN